MDWHLLLEICGVIFLALCLWIFLVFIYHLIVEHRKKVVKVRYHKIRKQPKNQYGDIKWLLRRK